VRIKSRLAVCDPPRGANITGWRASDELSKEYCQPAAYAPHIRRGRPRVLLCGATSVGVYQFRGLRPALAHSLNDDRLNAKAFSPFFHFRFCGTTTISQRRRRKVSREKALAPLLR